MEGQTLKLRVPAWAAQGLLLLGAWVLVLFGLSRYGIWDPWELSVADAARQFSAGERSTIDGAPLPIWLMAYGFRWFGIREWIGRLPLALSGAMTLLVVYVWVKGFVDRRAAAYALIVTATTPLFLFNSREMLGSAIGFFAQTLVALCAACALFRPRVFVDDTESHKAKVATGFWFVGLWVACGFSLLASGALLGVLPPLMAVAAAGGISSNPFRRDARFRFVFIAVCILALIVIAFVAQAVVADSAQYDLWLGGTPQGGEPPTFDAGIEDVFHAFAPWSAVLVVAGIYLSVSARLLASSGGLLAAVAVLWSAFGYACHALFTSRYGGTTFLPVAALSIPVALLFRHVDQSQRAFPTAAVVSVLLVGLLLRDFVLYPDSPLHGLAVSDLNVPDVFNPKLIWCGIFGAFAVFLFLGFASSAPRTPIDFRLPYRKVRAQWRKGRGFAVWMGLGALLLLAMLVFGATCELCSRGIGFGSNPSACYGLMTIAVRVGRKLFWLPFALPVLVALAQISFWCFAYLCERNLRFVPLMIVGTASGAYAAHGYLPGLSAHLSPREIYDTFNAFAGAGESLGEYHVSSRGAAYYAKGNVVDLASESALLDFLAGPERRWVVIPASDLGSLDRAFRRRTSRHLFVADARSARVVLASNHDVAGRKNENFLATSVVHEEPRVSNLVRARFEDKIELIGYNLELPHDGYVGAGERFKVTWYWRCLKQTFGSWRIFLHVDGGGLRLNGDHDPVDGKYPVQFWEPGDIVVDTQELFVPANYRPGGYTFFIGFFSGDTRLTVTEGARDNENRVKAGELPVR